jgi:hypothetical protein
LVAVLRVRGGDRVKVEVMAAPAPHTPIVVTREGG